MTNLDRGLNYVFKYWANHYKNPIQVIDSTTDTKASANGYTDKSGIWIERTEHPDNDVNSNSNKLIQDEIVAPNNYKAAHWQQLATGSLTIIDMDWYSRHCEFGIGTTIYVKATDTTYRIVAKSDYRPQAQYAEYGLKSIKRQVANDVQQ